MKLVFTIWNGILRKHGL